MRDGHWTIDDLHLEAIDHAAIRDDDTLFYLACSASFIESGSDLYTRNLVQYYDGDADVTRWLDEQWEPEELQHGRALRAYVNHVWPEFDWDAAYASFLREYAGYCKVELLAATRGLEMSARCVVEMGTATYYWALAKEAREPVFVDLAHRIANDEVSHYKHFYRYFRAYRERERLSRWRVFGTLARRTWELRSEDADCAVRHIARWRNPAQAEDKAYLNAVSSRLRRVVSRHMNAGTTLKMLLRPLDLPPRVEALVRAPIEVFMNRVFLR
ncbi:ferritin [Comamonas serinivorans]|uniref:Ferritin n=1 Tax=Comamonas serinivorans TaxID=1082851 RepID=A0A1Y0EJI2_9BURK|nr:ferritin-like domain-containing protein [Comamonas serinivorans]ARU03737.1 ferritin [Comamonas serinivorans]